METVFDEWNTYAQRKLLRPRAIDLESIESNAWIKVVAAVGGVE